MITKSDKNQFKELLSKNTSESIYNKSNNIRIGRVLEINLYRATVKMSGTGDVLYNVRIPNTQNIRVNDTVTVISYDPKTSNENYIVSSYSNTSGFNNLTLDNPTITGGSWTPYSPVWTNVNINNGEVDAAYTQIGCLIATRIKLVFGSSTSFTGNVVASLPKEANISYLPIRAFTGNATFAEAGANDYAGWARIDSLTTIRPNVVGVTNIFATPYAINATRPFTWGLSDCLFMEVIYECA